LAEIHIPKKIIFVAKAGHNPSISESSRHEFPASEKELFLKYI